MNDLLKDIIHVLNAFNGGFKPLRIEDFHPRYLEYNNNDI